VYAIKDILERQLKHMNKPASPVQPNAKFVQVQQTAQHASTRTLLLIVGPVHASQSITGKLQVILLQNLDVFTVYLIVLLVIQGKTAHHAWIQMQK
jgi:hypothetical protein